MELIEDDSEVLSESEIRTGPSAAVGPAITTVGMLVVAVALVIVLFRPSTDSVSLPPLDDRTEDGSESDPIAAPIGETDDRALSPTQTFVLPQRLPIPQELTVPPPGRKLLTLIGQNEVGQIVAFELSSGSVTEIDATSGQRFKPRAASANRVAGFRVFLGETISLGADGSIRSMPVTEMDLPYVFPTPDGSGFVVLESTTNALWLVDDDDSVESLPALPAGLTPERAVDGGLIVRTLDGVARRYDPASTEVGEPLVGTPLTIGRDRYVTLSCDAGLCRVTVRALGSSPGSVDTGEFEADEVIVELADGLTIGEQATISPSGRRLAFSGQGRVTVVDLDRGAEIEKLDEAGNATFTWGPDDSLFYWTRPAQASVGSPGFEVRLFDVDGHRSAIPLPPSVMDLNQPLHVVRSAN